MHDIKIIMSDVDGTLLNDHGHVSKRTIDAIKKARAQGLIFGLASGRDIESSESFYKAWGIEGLVDVFVGETGAHIKNYRLGIDEKAPTMKRKNIKSIIEHFHDLPVTFMVISNGCFFLTSFEDFDLFYNKIGKANYKVISIEELLQLEVTKIHLFCHQHIIPLIIERNELFDHPETIGIQTADTVYEYINTESSKSNGLRKVIEMDNMSFENLLVFGDADNDVTMLIDSKIGVVMANGTPLAKRAADYITEDNNHDGIAVFLEKYILNQL